MATFYVNGGGQTLSDCLKALPSGTSSANRHKVYVGPGTYDPILNWNANRHVEVIATEGPTKTFIDGHDETQVIGKTNGNMITDVIFTGFTLQHGYLEADEADTSQYKSAVAFYMTLRNCRLTQNKLNITGTKKSYSQSRYHLAMDCYMYGCEIDNNWTNGIGWRYSNFYGCDIHDNTMELTGGDGYSFGELFRCKVHDNLALGYLGYHGWSCLFYDNDVKYLIERPSILLNCVFFRNKGRLIDNFGSRGGVYNCIFLQNNGRSTALPTNTSLFTFYNADGTAVCNNIFQPFENGTAWNGTKGSNWFECEDNIFNCSDPGFVDAENLDFHLRPDSVAIGAGRVDGVYNNVVAASHTEYKLRESTQWFDMGSRRYDFEHPSCGAYEYFEKSKLYLPTDLHPMGI